MISSLILSTVLVSGCPNGQCPTSQVVVQQPIVVQSHAPTVDANCSGVVTVTEYSAVGVCPFSARPVRSLIAKRPVRSVLARRPLRSRLFRGRCAGGC